MPKGVIREGVENVRTRISSSEEIKNKIADHNRANNIGPFSVFLRGAINYLRNKNGDKEHKVIIQTRCNRITYRKTLERRCYDQYVS